MRNIVQDPSSEVPAMLITIGILRAALQDQSAPYHARINYDLIALARQRVKLEGLGQMLRSDRVASCGTVGNLVFPGGRRKERCWTKAAASSRQSNIAIILLANKARSVQGRRLG